MRLICGLVHLDGTGASDGTLDAMASRMIGPGLKPSQRTWVDGPAALRVLDFSGPTTLDSSLPRSRRGQVLAADVRLDVREALAGALASPESDPDALLLAALDRWGIEAVNRVLGDFALASWDPSSRTLLCARDAFGVRPLSYVHFPGQLFAFASLVRGLHGTFAKPQPDELAIARTLLSMIRPDDTYTTGIRRLPAAHLLELSGAGLVIRRYWGPADVLPRPSDCSPEEAARELRARIDEAIRCRMPPAGPVAVHLSGGLDSSAIAVLAARRLRESGRSLYAYSIRARQPEEYPEDDETPFVEAVMGQEPGMVWTTFHHAGFSHFLESPRNIETLHSLDATALQVAISAHAARHGASMILAGWGGDEGASFNGRGALAEALLNGHWLHLVREVGAIGKTRGYSWRRTVRAEILPYLVPESIQRLRSGGRTPATERVGSVRWFLTTKILDQVEDGAASRAPTFGPDARLNRLRLLENPFLAAQAQESASEGALFGIAYGFPLLDRRVVELAASLPSCLFLRGGTKRRLFRDAMEGVLPERVRWRPHKFNPTPDHQPVSSEQREDILRYLDGAAGHSAVRSMFELDRLRGAVGELPSREALRARTIDGRSARAVGRILCSVLYIVQHF